MCRSSGYLVLLFLIYRCRKCIPTMYAYSVLRRDFLPAYWAASTDGASFRLENESMYWRYF